MTRMKDAAPVLAMASIAILLVAVVFAPVPGHSVWLSRVHDFAHGPIFGCVAVLALVGLRRWPPFARWSWLRQYAIALGVASALGLLTEVAQIPAGRDASWLDLRHDVLGAVAVLALFALVDPVLRSRRSWTARGALLAIGVALLGFLAAPTLRAAVEYRDRRMSFPVIADFSSSVDLYFIWRIDIDRGLRRRLPEAVRRYPGEAGARVRFLPQRYPGVNFHEPFPDWRGFKTLAIDRRQSDRPSAAPGRACARREAQQRVPGPLQPRIRLPQARAIYCESLWPTSKRARRARHGHGAYRRRRRVPRR